MDELPLWPLRSEISAIMDRELNTSLAAAEGGWQTGWDWAMRLHPEACSPSYDVLVNSKSFFLFWASVLQFIILYSFLILIFII
jgi:hypothetical protein